MLGSAVWTSHLLEFTFTWYCNCSKMEPWLWKSKFIECEIVFFSPSLEGFRDMSYTFGTGFWAHLFLYFGEWEDEKMRGGVYHVYECVQYLWWGVLTLSFICNSNEWNGTYIFGIVLWKLTYVNDISQFKRNLIAMAMPRKENWFGTWDWDPL